jgi:hypothetical protein
VVEMLDVVHLPLGVLLATQEVQVTTLSLW